MSVGADQQTSSAETVAGCPGVYVLRVPLALQKLGYTNCYIIPDSESALVIDPGISVLITSQLLHRAASEIGFDLERARFFCTHLHFDHVSVLKRLAYPGMRILMGEVAYRNNPWNYYELRKALLRGVLIEEGVPPMGRRGLAALTAETRVSDLPGCSYDLLSEGQVICAGDHELRVIETPGHSRGHICLYDEGNGFLISGDHVLEKTTPGLSLPFEGNDSLRDYLDSLAKVASLRCATVLPGHGQPFSQIAERCDNLRQRHLRRLTQTYELVARNPGMNGYEVMRSMPWTRGGPYEDWDRVNPFLQLSMCAQTLSYLEFLRRIGELELVEDRDGRHYHVS